MTLYLITVKNQEVYEYRSLAECLDKINHLVRRKKKFHFSVVAADQVAASYV